MMRTHSCGDLRKEHVGREVALCGWCHVRRDHGGLIFLDLRDRSGRVQVVFNPQEEKEAFSVAQEIKSEYVLRVQGIVSARPEGTENPDLPTGEIEVHASRLEILNVAKTPPFQIGDTQGVDDVVRLKYRYLDLRSERMQRNLSVRHRLVTAAREYLNSQGFWEVETPILLKSTPEGARDFLVPARLYPGKFYALPQSPQLMKQTLMISGVERYYQIARCLRDEDPRADRQVEHTQIDIEMSFITEEDIYAVVEGLFAHTFGACGIDISTPFPRLTYEEAMERFGTDKPDLRFGMELREVSSIVKGTEFRPIAQTLDYGGIVKGLCVPQSDDIGRKEIDRLTAFAARFGAGGLIHLVVEDGSLSGPLAKFFTPEQQESLKSAFKASSGDMLLLIAGDSATVNESLARLRVHLAERLELIPAGQWKFAWVTDFPLFSWNATGKCVEAMHHPFTSPREEDLPLLDTDPLKVKGRLYDVVLNGQEVASGSIRIHRREIQEKVFKMIQLSPEEAERRFGFLLEAFEYGAPPHGGIAPGVDRLVAAIVGEENIREVIAFPKTATGADPLTGAPSEVEGDQLAELGIALRPSETEDRK
ncbi:MAG: aspartate--tRNA ligase [Armatimonadetes bacterium]|nr:aspartate--tRNA ligase [Armatimonadota bacterium]NIM23678.1 aspartate--tRNA ligase [Armatimonadota bacterium]NIM67549.1 aspartate--tRNA ligase [Armatimonadota bacterium]NIM76066.1 aspartate--tRNA ligase [Armatimonadota bacterium]NIN05736.1 aspartate--tRNA ligase [Armatimonadota bacterium]